MSATSGVQCKAASVLAHKIREALARETSDATLSGEVEIDGCHVGGKIRPANLEMKRVDRRLAEHQTGKRRVVIALRDHDGRTLTHGSKSEADGVEFAFARAASDTVIHVDEAAHWDALEGRFPVKRISHSEAYSLDGVHMNFVESFFSRLRRMVSGQHHHVSPKYLHDYAARAASLGLRFGPRPSEGTRDPVEN